MPPPPLVTLLPPVLARRRFDPLGRCPEPTYVLRWPAPPQAGSLETSAEYLFWDADGRGLKMLIKKGRVSGFGEDRK
jgi:hypothetical protein